MKIIKEEKDNFPYLTKIMIQNRINYEKNKIINNFEINNFLNNLKFLVDQEISYDYNNIKKLLNIIFDAIYSKNKNKCILPANIISETLDHKFFSNQTILLNFVFVGDTCVGKTSFLNRYIKYNYNESYLATIGIDKEIKYVKIYDNIFKIALWDFSGKERFKNLPSKYYQNADGILLFFDLAYKDTFDNIRSWINDIKENSKNNVLPLMYLIGNKIDLTNREVSKEEAQKYAELLRIKYFEISCKFNINIYEVMTRMIMESILKIETDNTFKDTLRKILYLSSKKSFNNSFNNSFKNILSKYKNY